MSFSNSYYTAYQALPEILEHKYSHLDFQNHCYLRMALDHIFKTKWDTKINRPAHKYLTDSQKVKVVKILENYITQPDLIQKHHKESLIFRRKCKKKQLWLLL